MNMSILWTGQILFTMQNNQQPGAALELAGLAVERLVEKQVTVKFDIELAVSELDDGLYMNWGFASSLFEVSTIERMAASFEELLRSIVAQPKLPVYQLGFTTKQDKLQLALWNQAGQNYDQPLCLQQIFEQQVQREPDATAVIFEQDSLSYRQLNERANQVAHWLKGQGVKPDTLVGLCVQSSLELAVGILAILKAGGGYLPLDFKHPTGRLQYMLSDSNIDVILCQTTTQEKIPVDGQKLLMLDDWATFADYPISNVDTANIGLTPSNLAYVIYTSGSTGNPKGVMISHRNVTRLFAASEQYFDFNHNDVWTLFHSYAFDFSVWEFWGALLYGGQLVVVPFEISRNPKAFNELLHREGVTVLNQTPSAFYNLIDVTATVRDLRYVIFGGEALEPARLAPWFEAFGYDKPQLINMYGITETTVHVTFRRVTAEDGGKTMSNIGLPLDDLSTYVCSHGQILPIGVTGELYVGGAGLARGYLNRQALTAERFIKNPYDDTQHDRLYRSGDLVRRLSNGDLEYVGRADDQVKIRGFRIELGEINSQLIRQPGVKDSLVMVKNSGGEKRLVAYVVPDVPMDEDFREFKYVEQLRQAVKQSLAEYMVPAVFMVLPSFPLTVNGKIDRRALPEVDISTQLEESYVAPSNPTEQKLCEIWQRLLRIERIGVHDNFFQLGGDSILSIQVVSRANQAGIGITTRQLFGNQTVAELAALATEAVVTDTPQEAMAGEIALLPIQQSLLMTNKGFVNHYNQAMLLVPPSALDFDMLKKIVKALYHRHDALRLRFGSARAIWRASHVPFDDAMLEASCLNEALPDDFAPGDDSVTQRCEYFQRSLDLEKGPLLKAVYFSHPEHPRLLLVVHHMVVDGVSWRILLADIELAFAACLAGMEISLPPKSSSFQQWGATLTEYAASARLASEKDYWQAQLDAEIPAFPMDNQVSEVPSYETTETVQIILSEEQTTSLIKKCSIAYRTTINELLLSGVYLGFKRWCQVEVLRITLEGHGREDLFEHLDTTQTVGWFTTAFPVILGCQANEVDELIRNVKEQYRAIPNNGIGCGVLHYLSEDARPQEAGVSPAELVFNYLGQFDQSLSADTEFGVAAESAGTTVSPHLLRDHILGLNGMAVQGKLQFNLDFSRAQFNTQTMEKLAADIKQGLAEVIEHCLKVKSGTYTPSDFPLAKVSMEQLDNWQSHYDIDRLYPATSMQQGMLFHTMLEAGAYVTQIFLTFNGPLNTDYFRQAWQSVVDRYDIFRTVFIGEGDDLHQLVVKQATIPWNEQDLRDKSPEQQAQLFEQFRQQDKAAGFDVAKAPLQRITLFRLTDRRYTMLWSHHHMLLDGWCTSIVYRDVMLAYQALQEGREAELPPVAVYQEYIDWLTRQDKDKARQYWKEYLADIAEPTPLVIDHLPKEGPGQGYYTLGFKLEVDATDTLQAFAKKQQTTVNTLMQLAWGILLNAYTEQEHVMFGATISGRPAEVPGIESMVGLFINAIPVKISINPDDKVIKLIESLHQSFQTSMSYGYLPLTQIQAQSKVKAGMTMFDSLLAFENFPIEAAMEVNNEPSEDAITVDDIGGNEQTNFKLTFTVSLQQSLVVQLGFYQEQFSIATIETLLAQLKHILMGLTRCERVSELRVVDEVLKAQYRQLRLDSQKVELEQPSGEETDGESYVAPTSATETKLSEIWSEILGLERIGINDNFFDFGGNSIKAMRVASSVNEQFNVENILRALFEHSTVKALADHIDKQAKSLYETITMVESNQPAPLSFAQQRLWFIDQLEPGNSQYNMPAGLVLTGNLDIAALQSVFDALVQRHLVMQTNYARNEDGPYQIVHRDKTVDIERVDLTAIGEDQLRTEVERLFRAQATKPFDLARDLMIRVMLIDLAEHKHVLLYTMHHVASDGWSMGILNREFVALYNAFSKGRLNPLPSLEIQYADFARWQRESFTQERISQLLDFWKTELHGIPALHGIPLDRARPAKPDYRGDACARQIGNKLVDGLNKLCSQHDVTLFMLLESAFAYLLSQYSGEDDIVIGCPIAGRNHRKIEPLIGLFINTLVFRHRFSEVADFGDVLAQTKKKSLGAFANQELPFEMIVDELQLKRSLSHNPIFQIMFVLQNNEQTVPVLSGLELSGLPGGESIIKFDLELTASENDLGMSLNWSYATSLFNASTIEIMANHFEQLLQALVDNPAMPLCQLSKVCTPQRQFGADLHWVKLDGIPMQTDLICQQICRHELVNEAIVCQHPDDESQALIAYVVPHQNPNDLAFDEINFSAALERYLFEMLADYSRPQLVVVVPALPVGEDGYVDRVKLPLYEAAFSLEDGESTLSAQEQEMADLWCKLLKKESVGPNDNFFDLGGNSLLAIQMVTEASNIGFTLTVGDIWKNQTVASLCQAISAKQQAQPVTEQPINHCDADTIKLTDYQQQILDDTSERSLSGWTALVPVTQAFTETHLRTLVRNLLKQKDQLSCKLVEKDNVVNAWYREFDRNAVKKVISVKDIHGVDAAEIKDKVAAIEKDMAIGFDLFDENLFAVVYIDAGEHSCCVLAGHRILMEEPDWIALVEDFTTRCAEMMS